MQHGDNEFDMLQQSYTEYSGEVGMHVGSLCPSNSLRPTCTGAGALGEPCAEAGKARLASLSDQLQAKGVYG